ncbi:MAG: transposase [Longicatena sp.]
MYLTITIHMNTTKKTEQVINDYATVFKDEIDFIIGKFVKYNKVIFYPYAWVNKKISYFSKNQVIHYAEILFEKRKSSPHAEFSKLFSLASKSFEISENEITIEFGVNFYIKQITLPIHLHAQQINRFKQGEIIKMDMQKENNGYFAKIIIKIPELVNSSNVKECVMGVDVGMKCPAVCYTSSGKVKFIGNGREIKYHLRKINEKFQNIAKDDYEKFKKFNHKEQEYRNYIDHCISKAIIDFAIKEGVTTIHLEKLTNMQKKFTYQDQKKWSYYRLQEFIEYKAKIYGIKVIYINPKLTSKRCPNCGKINNVKGREYKCSCGFRKHRDIVGAMNILHAPEAS